MALRLAFAAQALLLVGAFWLGTIVSKRSRHVWTGAVVAALVVLLAWPLMRFFPTAPIRLFGAPAVACFELTGLFIPATFVFSVGARQAPKASDRRAVLLLAIVGALCFARVGSWMFSGPLHTLGRTRFIDGVCTQTTGYTCVAASLVTLLRARGIETTETEMARLAHVEVNGGATDSRALWALDNKLAGTRLHASYIALDLPGLIAAPKPCLVQLDWSFFISHMVPVLAADANTVVIGDPLEGRKEMKTADFVRQWKGNAILVTGEDPSNRTIVPLAR